MVIRGARGQFVIGSAFSRRDHRRAGGMGLYGGRKRLPGVWKALGCVRLVAGIQHKLPLLQREQGKLAQGTRRMLQRLQQDAHEVSVQARNFLRREKLRQEVIIHAEAASVRQTSEMDAQLLGLIAAVMPAA